MLTVCTYDSLLKFSCFTIVDIEVSGMDKTDKIIEIGAIKVINGKSVQRFHSFVRSDVEYDESTLRFLGIAEDSLLNAPDTSSILQAFKDFAGNDVLLTNNAPFTVFYLNGESIRCNIAFDNKVIDMCTAVNLPHPRSVKKYASEMNISVTDDGSVCNSLDLIEKILRKSSFIHD